ncbi:MAG: CPA2 family monovalent cation:H+ antiporter-2 [Enterobacterales bacterium]|jgi:CPA2 family monovalent cation:H+ antiporter-2
MHNFILIVIATVAIATLLNVFLKRFNMPTVIGYIFTGIIVGAIFNLKVQGNEELEHVAEFGVVFLMFTIGLEFSISHLKKMKREVFIYGFLQVFVSGIVLALIAHFIFAIEYKAAIVAGFGLSLSSTAIVLKILNESGQITTDYGRNSLGILIFQDIAVIPILLMIAIFTNNDKSLADLLLETTIDAAIALSILIFIGKYFLSYFFKIVSNSNSKEIYMGSILFVVIGASYIAHYFGFSYSLGAFIAGMMIADTIYKYQVEADLIPFRDLLLGVFFVSIGLQIDLGVVKDNILIVLGLSLFVMLVKVTVTYLILFRSNTPKTSLKTAITLSEIGEFSLVVFSLLMAEQMMDTVTIQILMVTIVLTMIYTPFLINNLNSIVGLVIKTDIAEESFEKSSVIGGHVILCGYGTFGQAVSEKLQKEEINHVIITDDTDDYVKAKESERNVVFGDPADRVLLERLRIQDAMSIVIALESIEEIQKVSASVTLVDPDLKVIAKVASEKDKGNLDQFNHDFLLDGNVHTATLLVDKISKSRILAKETSSLQYLDSYSLDNPLDAIEKTQKEQARLLDIISKSFNAFREEKDIMQIKALYDSFKVLNEIVGAAIRDILTNAKLESKEYEKVNLLMDNQTLLVALNEELEKLGKELKLLGDDDKTKSLAQMAVEGLDTVLLTLKDIANSYDDMDMDMLKGMTQGEGKGLSKIRESYLDTKMELNADSKALLVSSTNHMEGLKAIFGSIGENYRNISVMNG